MKPMPAFRAVAFNLTEFGAVGDGVTVNTEAFEKAVLAISKIEGGGQLNVPAGKWLTAPFNLTSHMTLFLDQDAVILGIDVSFFPFFHLGFFYFVKRLNLYYNSTSVVCVCVCVLHYYVAFDFLKD